MTDTMWSPPVMERWFINPMNTIVIFTINHSDIGVMCTNLAIVWGPHFVRILKRGPGPFFFGGT